MDGWMVVIGRRRRKRQWARKRYGSGKMALFPGPKKKTRKKKKNLRCVRRKFPAALTIQPEGAREQLMACFEYDE